MSVRIAYSYSFFIIRPMAAPAAVFFIGTPASKSARVEPHTEAIDEEPLEDKISDTILMVYGKFSWEGISGVRALSASAPWPISRRPGPRMGLTSPTE